MKGEKELMKANIISSFAAGLLVSAAVCGAVYFSTPNSSEKSSKKATDVLTEEQMINNLSSSGYVILTDTELKQQLATAKAEKSEKQPQQEKEKDKAEDEVVYRTIVNVSPGMTSIDVGRALVKGKIIGSAKTFFNEVEKRGLSNELKPGTFELDSNMTMDEVISSIFK